jgi:hypothetical protein
MYMPDLRRKVVDDRGLIKEIELLIPGFHGYREREDLRSADSLLREQLAISLGNIRKGLEWCRDHVVMKKELQLIERTGSLVRRCSAIEEGVRHAEQGYTGISADFRIEQVELNQLYEWDLGLMKDVREVIDAVSDLKTAFNVGDEEAIQRGLYAVSKGLDDFNDLFERRRIMIAGLEAY